MNHSRCLLFLALTLSTFGATTGFPLQAAAPPAANSSWDNLKMLTPGEQIRVALNDAKSYQGEFQALNDEGVALRLAAGEQTFARKDILRVSSKGKNHRLRNILIGAAIGASLGVPVSLANRRNSWWRSSWWAPPVFASGGAAIGAVIPTGGWHEVYRAH